MSEEKRGRDRITITMGKLQIPIDCSKPKPLEVTKELAKATESNHKNLKKNIILKEDLKKQKKGKNDSDTLKDIDTPTIPLQDITINLMFNINFKRCKPTEGSIVIFINFYSLNYQKNFYKNFFLIIKHNFEGIDQYNGKKEHLNEKLSNEVKKFFSSDKIQSIFNESFNDVKDYNIIKNETSRKEVKIKANNNVFEDEKNQMKIESSRNIIQHSSNQNYSKKQFLTKFEGSQIRPMQNSPSFQSQPYSQTPNYVEQGDYPVMQSHPQINYNNGIQRPNYYQYDGQRNIDNFNFETPEYLNNNIRVYSKNENKKMNYLYTQDYFNKPPNMSQEMQMYQNSFHNSYKNNSKPILISKPKIYFQKRCKSLFIISKINLKSKITK